MSQSDHRKSIKTTEALLEGSRIKEKPGKFSFSPYLRGVVEGGGGEALRQEYYPHGHELEQPERQELEEIVALVIEASVAAWQARSEGNSRKS